MAQYKDKSWLQKRYVEDGQPLSVLAEEAGCTDMTVRRWLKKHGIGTRSKREAALLSQGVDRAGYRVTAKGYEEWQTKEPGRKSPRKVKVHRLAAVAWFGWDAVADREVHHIIPIPWLNTEWNLSPQTRSEHAVTEWERARGDEPIRVEFVCPECGKRDSQSL